VSPLQGAKFQQELAYGTEEWHRPYSTLRNSIEGMNGYVKDGAQEALADPTRRRIRGVAAQSMFVALLLFAANVRKIDAFLQQEAAIETGSVRRLRPRRRTQSVEDFRPSSGTPQPPDCPGPD
jgi:hypothetical protein